MPLTISLRFPNGKYVAAAWNDRNQPEWPPHPARFCLGLVDVLHKSGNTAPDRAAINLLCAEGAPIIHLTRDCTASSQEGYFVPLNPTAFKGSITPGRKPRSFPCVLLDSENPTIFFSWPDFDPALGIITSLDRLLADLPRFGHSSSFVEAKICDAPQKDLLQLDPISKTDSASPDEMLRVPYHDLLKRAEESFDETGRTAELEDLIKKNSKTPRARKFLSPSASPRGRHDPIHIWAGYHEAKIPGQSGPWDERMIILPRKSGTRLDLPSTLSLTTTLHKTILDRWERLPDSGSIPEWISGHLSDRKTSQSTHLGLSVLSDIRSPLLKDNPDTCQHARGEIKGISLLLPMICPADLDPFEFRQHQVILMRALFGDQDELVLCPKNKSWDITFSRSLPIRPMKALRPKRWTTSSEIWTTVTPIVLDRHPKPHFKKDPIAWSKSCIEIISKSCERIGLPRPIEVMPDLYSQVDGSPPGPAFPAQAPKPGRPSRFHVHASIRFPEGNKITGPILIGAGRYRGYGQLIPLHPDSAQS